MIGRPLAYALKHPASEKDREKKILISLIAVRQKETVATNKNSSGPSI